jgi:multisubunit Na+/H+ antiporter MnhB subunit
MPALRTPKPPFWTSLWLLVILCVAWCLLFVVFSVAHAIPTRVLGFFGVAMFAGSWLLGYLQFKEKKKYPPPPWLSDPTRIRKSIRNLRIAAMVFALLLINGYFATRHDPLFPRIVGATINIAFIALFLKTIRNLQRKLKD